MPYKAIAILILFIAIAIISATIVFRDEIFTVSYTKDANYDRLSNLSSISLAIALLFQDIPELFEIEQKIFNKMSTLLFIFFIFTGWALFISSANYITEMTR